MQPVDTVFAGSVPEIYDRYLGPMLFAPFAADAAERVRSRSPRRVLETAAGTGIVTRALVSALPGATIVATDLNPAMLQRAEAMVPAPNVAWQQADATTLPFADASFDLVLCQFGVMFFPDKPAAFREAARVLAPGGTFVFSVWDALAANPVPTVVNDTVGAAFPADPPKFIERTPHGWSDTTVFAPWLADAGFEPVVTAAVDLRSRAASMRDAAIGFVQGTPVRNEIEKRDPGRLAELTDAVTAALSERFGGGALDAPMRAFVISASRGGA